MTTATLQIKVNGGAPQTGGVVATTGDTVQLTAADKTGWGSPATRWEIYDYPPGFALPSGWTNAADDSIAPTYYCLGNADPPSFALSLWGKYAMRVTALGKIVDEGTFIETLSPGGLHDIVAREGSQFGGSKLQWVRPIKQALRRIDDMSGATATVALSDANATITLASSRRRSAALTLLTADRYITFGTTGSEQLGDSIVVERLDRSTNRLGFIDNSGSFLGFLNRPGTYRVRWDGTAWRRDNASVRRDLSIFTPWEFDARGDGTTNDTAALVAMFTAFFAGGAKGRVEFGKGVFLTDPIQVVGNVSTPFHMVGDSGASYGINGTVIRSRASSTANPLLNLRAVTGFSVESVDFDCNYLTKYATLVDTVTGQAGSSGGVFRRCGFFRPADVAGAASFAAGPETDPQTQSDTITLEHCYLYGKPSTPAYNADGFKVNQGGNAKCYTLRNCQFGDARRHINWDAASGSMHVDRSQFEGSYVVDISQGAAGQLTVTACQAERSARMYTGVAGAVASFRGCEWNGGNLCTDDAALDTGGAKVSVRSSTMISQRFTCAITGVNTGTDVVTYTGNEFGQVPDGSPVTVWSTTDQIGNLVEGTVYYTRDGAGAGPSYTCKLAATLGGAALDLSGTFGGSLAFAAKTKIKASGIQQASAGVYGSFESAQTFYQGVSNQIAVYDGANEVLSPSYAMNTNANGQPCVVSSSGDQGGVTGVVRRLREIGAAIEQRPHLGADMIDTVGGSTFQCATKLDFFGASGRTWIVQRIKYTDLKQALTSLYQYFRIPARARITQVYCEVVTAFGLGAGQTGVHLDVGDAYVGGGSVLASCDLMAAAGTVYGLTDAQLGTGMVRAAAIQGGYRPGSGVGLTWASPALMQINIAVAGANAGNGTVTTLTAGEALVSIETTVPPRSGS